MRQSSPSKETGLENPARLALGSKRASTRFCANWHLQECTTLEGRQCSLYRRVPPGTMRRRWRRRGRQSWRTAALRELRSLSVEYSAASLGIPGWPAAAETACGAHALGLNCCGCWLSRERSVWEEMIVGEGDFCLITAVLLPLLRFLYLIEVSARQRRMACWQAGLLAMRFRDSMQQDANDENRIDPAPSAGDRQRPTEGTVPERSVLRRYGAHEREGCAGTTLT